MARSPRPPDSPEAQEQRETYAHGPPQDAEARGAPTQNLADATDTLDARRARMEGREMPEAPVPGPGPNAPRRRGRGVWVALIVIAAIVAGVALATVW